MNDYEADIIRRCTVDGTTRWAHVARMLGRPEAAVRAQFGALMQPSRLVCEAMPPEDQSLKSPHVRTFLKDRIAARLRLGSSTARTISEALGTSIKTVKEELARMSRAGLVKHQGPAPYTWSLSQERG